MAPCSRTSCRTPEPVRGRARSVALAWTGLAEDDRTLQALLRLNQARDWPGFVAAAQDVGVADAEHPLRRCRGPHRVHRPRPGAGAAPGRRPLAGAGLERRLRLAGRDPVRGPAAGARPAGRRADQRQQRDRAAGLPLSLDRRLGGLLSGPASRAAARGERLRSGRARGDAGRSAVAAGHGPAADHARGRGAEPGGGRGAGRAARPGTG